MSDKLTLKEIDAQVTKRIHIYGERIEEFKKIHHAHADKDAVYLGPEIFARLQEAIVDLNDGAPWKKITIERDNCRVWSRPWILDEGLPPNDVVLLMLEDGERRT
jgi:hypothetical protein